MKNLLPLFLILLSFKAISSTPIGFLDTTHPTSGITGWALEPSLPSANLTIHFYANAPAGSSGSVLIGYTVANQARPDVNNATGYGGNHGFVWFLPFGMITPCPISIYAYAIDPYGQNNKLLTNSPKNMPILEGAIAKNAGNSTIYIAANSQFGGAIYSLKWDGVEFINHNDHGRLLQSAASFYSSPNPDYSQAECYNPTEAGSHNDGNSICTSSKLLSFSNNGNILTTSTQMAFYGPTTSNCTNPNTTPISDYVFDKTVTIGTPVSAHAIKYEVAYHVPSNETRTSWGQFEALTGYLNKSTNSSASFTKFFNYEQSTQSLTQVYSDGAGLKPIIISTADEQHAMGIYSPEIKINDATGYYSFNNFSDCSKWNFVRRIPSIQSGTTYSFTGYICVGSLEDVRVTLAALVAAYPNI